MSDVLTRILMGALGGGQQQGGAGMGGGMVGGAGGSPLGVPRMPGQGGQYGGTDPMAGGLGGLLGGLLGGGQAGGMAGGAGGGLGSLLGGLLGGMAGGQGGASRGGMPGGLGGGMGGMKGVVMMALLAYLMRGQGGRAGLASITDQFRAAGLGEQADSWIGTGANRDISPQEVARVLPPGALDDIEQHTGLARDEVLSELSRGLPRMVDRLTPRGRLPDTDDELNDVDETDVLGSFGLTPGAAYGKTRPGDGGMKG